jgi:antitoxin component of RelBE/YafQ-DinJ toxin-antitoxin module
MNTKLTLSIDKKVISEAKRASKRKGLSLSKIVENYLKEFTDTAPVDKKRKAKASIIELVGILGKVPQSFDYKEELHKILEEKHLG